MRSGPRRANLAFQRSNRDTPYEEASHNRLRHDHVYRNSRRGDPVPRRPWSLCSLPARSCHDILLRFCRLPHPHWRQPLSQRPWAHLPLPAGTLGSIKAAIRCPYSRVAHASLAPQRRDRTPQCPRSTRGRPFGCKWVREALTRGRVLPSVRPVVQRECCWPVWE